METQLTSSNLLQLSKQIASLAKDLEELEKPLATEGYKGGDLLFIWHY